MGAVYVILNFLLTILKKKGKINFNNKFFILPDISKILPSVYDQNFLIIDILFSFVHTYALLNWISPVSRDQKGIYG